MFYFFSIPVVSTVVEDHRGLTSTETLEFHAVNVLNYAGQDMAKPSLSLSFLKFHQFKVHKYERVLLNFVCVICGINFRQTLVIANLILFVKAFRGAVKLLILSSPKIKVLASNILVDNLVSFSIVFVFSDVLVSLDIP